MLSSLTRWLVNKIIREPKGTLRRPLRPSAKPISPRVFCLPSNLICAPCTCDACPMIMSPADHRVVLIFILLCGPFVSRWAGLCVARASAIFCPVPVAADGPLPARGLRSSYATSAMCCAVSLLPPVNYWPCSLQPAGNSIFLSRQTSPATNQPANQQYFPLKPDQPSHQPPASRRKTFSRLHR